MQLHPAIYVELWYRMYLKQRKKSIFANASTIRTLPLLILEAALVSSTYACERR